MARATSNGTTTTDETTIADLSKQIDVLRTDLSDLVGTLSALGISKSSELTDAAREKGEETAEYLALRAREAQAQAQQFITTQPATALGLAAGAGFLVGLLTSRR